MLKKYNIKNLDCAHCAKKLENDLSKIEGVTKCNVNFLSQKITVEFDLEEEKLLEEMKAVIKKTTPSVKLV